MSDAFIRAATEISRIELSTPKAEPGSVLRLRSYSHELAEKVLEADEFRWHWQPVPAPEAGNAYDHISPTSLFPKDYRWLQTVTQYGWVKVRFPKTYKGQLEYSLKTPDIERESALLLEEWHPTVEQGCRAHTGIVRGGFLLRGPRGGLQRCRPDPLLSRSALLLRPTGSAAEPRLPDSDGLGPGRIPNPDR